MFGKPNGGGGGMPAGLAMMIKSFLPGFDPEDFGRKIEEVRNGAGQVVQRFDAHFIAIRNEQAAQRVMLEELLRVARMGSPAISQAEAEAAPIQGGVARIDFKE
jgi:hypothetical protein